MQEIIQPVNRITAIVNIVLLNSRNGDRLTPEFAERFKSVVNSEHNPTKYISADPGTHSGICGYDKKYYLQFLVTIHADDIVDFLELFQNVEKCIYERYLIYKHKAQQHTFSDVETLRVIGRIEGWAKRKKIELIGQLASDKAEGYKWINQEPPTKTNKMRDQMDANVHFMRWAIKTGRIQPKP